MERQLQQLVRLVDDLLDVSRITRGTLELRRRRIEVSAVVLSAVEASRPLIEAPFHELSLALPPDTIYVDGDPARLAQVISNLLNNAAKFTEAGGRITLHVLTEGSEVVIRVRDTGVGIPPEMLGSIFEMFRQVDSTLERARNGLGIGLTLVRQLVEMHGGRVLARSEGRGKGSEFEVRLPLAEAPARKAGAQRDDAAAPAAPSRRVLVVDDNDDAATSLAMLLRLMSHHVRVAHDGLTALEMAAEEPFEVVLLDIGMPGLNGLEVARRLREQPRGGSLILIALTGWGQEGDRRRSRQAGFDFHMVKPVDPDALASLLAEGKPSRAR
jgi:CheY-like chemotaxis protein